MEDIHQEAAAIDSLPSVLVCVRQNEAVVLKSRAARRFHGSDHNTEHAAG